MFSLLKSDGKYFGLVHRNSSYIIGFKNPSHAKLVRQKICNKVKPELCRDHYEDITHFVKNSLLDAGIASDGLGSITIDDGALVVIPWSSKGEIKEAAFEIEPVSEQTMLAFPFERNIGIIIANDIFLKPNVINFQEYIFASHIIDPSQHMGLFRSKLVL